MAHNGVPCGMFPDLTSGMLGLEVPVHQQPNPQNPQNQQNPHQLHHPQMVAYAHHHEADQQQHPQTQDHAKHAYPYGSSTRPRQQLSLSDEDEHGFNGDDGISDGKRKMSPWQRMKWTDNMVRLLIMAVYYIGDEAGSEANDPTGKKKAGGLAQKKGKWKSVSRAMMEKGFLVSPQQCEDKFNDLNKRYKRVNDILGKGTSCKVVENQSLLDTMDLSPKLKAEVRKLLNSKHLFYREMCAYHSSCGHSSTAVACGTSLSPDVSRDQSQAQHQPATEQLQQRCSHSSEGAQMMNNSRTEIEGSKMAKMVLNEEEDEEDDDSFDEDEDDYGEDEYEDDAREGNSRGQSRHGQEDEDDHDEKPSEKRPRKDAHSLTSSLMHQFNGELITLIQDGAKSPWEKKQYIKVRLLQLEEQKMNYELQAFELEKKRLKWVRFSSKKEREMERAQQQNERRRLESERMVLLVRQKELELLDLQHRHHQQQISSNKRSDPSSITG